MIKNFYFLCGGVYQLFIAITYVNEIRIKSNSNKCILIASGKLDFKNYIDISFWDEYYYIPDPFINKNNLLFNLMNYIKIKKQIKKIFLKYIKESYILFTFNDFKPVYQLIIKIFSKNTSNIILVDEGLFLYYSLNNKTILFTLSNIFYSIILKINAFIREIGSNKKVKYIIAKFPNLIPEYKLKNKEIIKQDLKIFQKKRMDFFISLLLVKNINILKKSYDILYLSQPLSFDLSVNQDEEIKIIKYLFDNYLSDKTICIKMHPRESCDKYDSIINNKNIFLFEQQTQNIPIEIISNYLSFKLILTPFSSASIHLNLIKKTSVILLYKLFDISISNLDIFFHNLNNFHILQKDENLSIVIENILKNKNINSIENNNEDENISEIKYIINEIGNIK